MLLAVWTVELSLVDPVLNLIINASVRLKNIKGIYTKQKYTLFVFLKNEKLNTQEEWINQLNDAADNVLDTNVKNALSILLQYSNVPRKKKQFNNFVRNSCHISDQLIENVWNILEETKNKLSLKKNEMIVLCTLYILGSKEKE